MTLSYLVAAVGGNGTVGGEPHDPIGTPTLTWINVAIAGCFILFNCKSLSLFKSSPPKAND